MKKTLFALAALTAFSGVASAQSSVTLFGVLDVNMRSVKTGATRVSKMENDGISSSRFGIRGEEDLGNGLKAGFWLEAPISADTGAGNTTKLFNRRSTVSLTSASLGEVRLGRDNQTVWTNAAAFDVFGTVGVATAAQLIDKVGSGVTDTTRTDNAISYFLPGGLGGVYGQVQFAMGEGANKDKLNGTRIGFKTGGFDAAVATSYVNVAANAVTSPNGARWKQVHAGASYDFSVVKLYAQYIVNKNTDTNPDGKQKIWELAASAPVGAAGLVKLGYAKSTDYKAATKIGLGYQHNLSKRTALYANYGQIKNKADKSDAVVGESDFIVKTAPAATLGGLQKSTGYEIGIRHNF